MKSPIQVVIDIKNSSRINLGNVAIRDTTNIEITLMDDSVPVKFTSPVFELHIKKYDGNFIRQKDGIKFVDNKVSINLWDQANVYPGIVYCELLIKDGGRATTSKFYFVCKKTLDSEIIESIRDVEILDNLDIWLEQSNLELEKFKLYVETLTNNNVDLESLVEIKDFMSINLEELKLQNIKASKNNEMLIEKNNEAGEKITELDKRDLNLVEIKEENIKATSNTENLDRENLEATTNVSNLDIKNNAAIENVKNLDSKNSTASTNIKDLDSKNSIAGTNITSLGAENTNARTNLEELHTSIEAAKIIKEATDEIIESGGAATKIELDKTNTQLERMENIKGFSRYGDIILPHDLYNNINFRLYRDANNIVQHNFNVDELIKDWRIIYLSENGNDSNNGDVIEKPKKTLDNVLAKINSIADTNVIIKIISTSLTRNNSNVTITNKIINKNIAIISDNDCYIGSIEIPLSWTKTGNCYSTNRGGTTGVYDKLNKMFDGSPMRYKKVDTQSQCDALKGSYALVGTTLYVRRFDDLNIDNNILVTLQTGSLMFDLQADVKFITKNINFLCTHDFNPNVKVYSSLNIGHFIGINTRFIGSQVMNGLQIENIKSSWLFNCSAPYTARDGFNYHNYIKTSKTSFMLEYNCIAYENGVLDMNNNNNATTCHDGINILRIGCIGFNTKGPVLADVNGCYSVNYDCTMYDSLLNGKYPVKTAFWFDDDAITGNTTKAYLINCKGGGVETYGINTDGIAKVNVNNFSGNNINTSVLNFLE